MWEGDRSDILEETNPTKNESVRKVIKVRRRSVMRNETTGPVVAAPVSPSTRTSERGDWKSDGNQGAVGGATTKNERLRSVRKETTGAVGAAAPVSPTRRSRRGGSNSDGDIRVKGGVGVGPVSESDNEISRLKEELEYVSKQLKRDSLSKKLKAIRRSSADLYSGRYLFSKLFNVCATELQVLFGQCNSSTSTTSSRPKEAVNHGNLSHVTPMDDAKVSRFYIAVTKMSNGMVQFEIFYKALLDLCDMQNEVILYRSLRILHVVLLHFGGSQCISTIRDNCAIEASNDVSAFGGTEDSEIGCHKHRIADVLYVSDTKPSCIEWFSLFQLMHRISTDATDEPILYEVVSIMNVILKRDGPLKRERYGQITVFQTVPKLFRKEAGFRVRKEAVHLIYLLVNCPTVLASLYSGFRENMPNLTSSNNVAAFEGLSTILAGLEDCLICSGNVLEALELRRNAITLLSYLVSFGTSTACNKTDFLVLIMRLLAFEIGSQIYNCSDPIDIVKERTLLVREALTFLNRIVSHPTFSGAALRALTATREVASLTIDTSRLSLRCKNIWKDDNQILDLACTINEKVSAYLDDNVSS